MLFDIPESKYKPGDKLTITHNGVEFKIEIEATTVVEWERKYLVRYEDGSKDWVSGAKFVNMLN